MKREKRLHVEDLPPDHDWAGADQRIQAAEKRKSDAVWRRKTSNRHRRKRGKGR